MNLLNRLMHHLRSCSQRDILFTNGVVGNFETMVTNAAKHNRALLFMDSFVVILDV